MGLESGGDLTSYLKFTKNPEPFKCILKPIFFFFPAILINDHSLEAAAFVYLEGP